MMDGNAGAAFDVAVAGLQLQTVVFGDLLSQDFATDINPAFFATLGHGSHV